MGEAQPRLTGRAAAVVVLGQAGCAPRFGFVSASQYGRRCVYDASGEAFVAMEVARGALADAAGLVGYAPQGDAFA